MADTWTVQQAGDWSRGSENADSPWYGGGNPASGIPVSGDTVNGKLSTNINFDVDQSGFASGLAGLDLKGGYITFKEGITTYLKMAGDFTSTVAGAEVRVGTSALVPFTTASDGTIYMNGNYAIKATSNNYITYEIYCNEPTVKYVQLTGAEAVGQTRLEYTGSDLTAYPDHWKVGAIIHINDYNSLDSEARVISAITSTYIDITVGLTNAKIADGYVVLISRNFRILGSTTTITNGIVQFGYGTINCELRGGSATAAGNGYYVVQGVTIGGTIANLSIALYTCYACTINAVISQGYSGYASGLMTCRGCRINGIVLGQGYGLTFGINNYLTDTCILSGNGFAINLETNFISKGAAIKGNGVGITCSTGTMINTVLANNGTADTNQRCNIRAISSSFLSATQVTFVNNVYGMIESGFGQIAIEDYAGTPDAFYAWMYAGTIEPRSGGDPEFAEGVTVKYNPQVATHPTYRDYSLGNLSEGQKVEVRAYMQHSATGFSQRGKLEIFHWSDDPFFGGTALYTWTAEDNTDEQFNGYEFEAAENGEFIARISCKNASGNLFASLVSNVLSEELTILEAIQDAIGTPVAFDSGTATIAGMLTKMADDNDGADYDAGTDSLHEKEGMSAEDVADAVWDEAIADHTIATTFGAKNQKVVPSETIADYKATGFAVAGDAMTLTGDYDAAKTAAKAGDAMTLENDAITAAKFDESTAFPVKHEDANSTKIARTGADSDTLETLSDQMDTATDVTDKLDTMLEADGANYKFTADALQEVSVDLTTLEADVKRLLGLEHENCRMDNPTFDSNNNTLTARFRTYTDAASVGTDSNVLATYNMTATFSGAGKFTTVDIVKEE